MDDEDETEIRASLKFESLNDMLQQHEEDAELMVVTVIGPARKGKSFLLNLMALYIEHLMVRVDNYTFW